MARDCRWVIELAIPGPVDQIYRDIKAGHESRCRWIVLNVAADTMCNDCPGLELRGGLVRVIADHLIDAVE